MKVEDAEEVDGAAQGQHGKSKSSQGRAEKVASFRLAAVQGSPVFFYPFLLVFGLAERRLNGNLEPAQVVVLERYEAKRLFTH